MNYELAKKLKEAGFKQEARENCGSEYALPVGYTWMFEEWRRDLKQPEIPAKIPTLSELIEACGKSFYSLTFTGETYTATGLGDKIGTTGNTPEEAVARLWLALQEKPNKITLCKI